MGSFPILKEVTKGLAHLMCQAGKEENDNRTRLCNPAACQKAFEVLAPQIIYPFRDATGSLDIMEELGPEATVALQKITAVDSSAFPDLVSQAMTSVFGTSAWPEESDEVRKLLREKLLFWQSAPPQSLLSLRVMLTRLAFIGCSATTPGVNPLQPSPSVIVCLWELVYMQTSFMKCQDYPFPD